MTHTEGVGTASLPSVASDRNKAGRRLLSVGGLGLGGAVIALAYHQFGVGIPCPWLALTGWWCPLCGGTRMASAALEGDFAAAFAWNPAVFIGMLVLAVATVGWGVEFLGGRRPPWRGWVSRVTFQQGFAVACILAVVWTVGRNLGRILVGG